MCGRKNPTPSSDGDQSMVGAEGEEHASAGDPEVTSTLVAASADVEPSPDPPSSPDRDGGVATPESKDEANVSIGKVSTISKEDGTEMDHPALSPPVTLPSAQEIAVPPITTLTEV